MLGYGMVNTTSSSPPPLAICVAPNGARRTRGEHPALPITSEEIGRTAAACAEVGAGMIHLHVRDLAGRHSLDAHHYREAIVAIRREAGPDLAIQITTEAMGIYTPAQQRMLLRDLRPEAASVALCELIPDAREEVETAALYVWALETGIGLQHILYSANEAERFVALARRGVVPEDRPHALFVLGRYTTGQRSSPRDVTPFLVAWPEDWPWSVCAFGQQEALCLTAAVALGGHVRTGFENNIHRPDGTVAWDNAESVRRIVAVASAAGRDRADPMTTRQIFNIAP